jgi:signal transduction histidine kinase
MKTATLQQTAIKGPRFRGLQAQMALSYMRVTLVLVLFLEIIVGLLLFQVLSNVVLPQVFELEATQVAQRYALAATLQAQQGTLPSRVTFQANRPASLVLPGIADGGIPYIDRPATDAAGTRFALLIAPDGGVLASSFPGRYTVNALASNLLPERTGDIAHALKGQSIHGHASGSAYALEPIWSRQEQPVGAIYVQLPVVWQSAAGIAPWQPGLELLIVSTLMLLLITAPLSLLFGFLTTRPLLSRLRDLGAAFAWLAEGAYDRRLTVVRADEPGYLEQQFNLLAQQLATSVENERRLSEQHARLAERTRLARDLHDSVKQHIFAVSMQVGAALSQLEHKPEKTRQHLQTADELIYEAQQELNTLISELRLPDEERIQDDEEASAAMLSAYVLTWSRQNSLPVDLDIAGDIPLPPALALALLRVLQEALSNVLRHSQATHTSIALSREQGQVILTIRDNGAGFTPAARGSPGMGLHSMRERMEELGGNCEVHSQPDRGTWITARVPCSGSVGSEFSSEGKR